VRVLVRLYAMWMRTSDFADNWPKYENVIKKSGDGGGRKNFTD